MAVPPFHRETAPPKISKQALLTTIDKIVWESVPENKPKENRFSFPFSYTINIIRILSLI